MTVATACSIRERSAELRQPSRQQRRRAEQDRDRQRLREFGTGPRAVSRAGLDELPASKPIEHLRAILVATSTLPPRDEHLARLERWIARTLAERGDPGQRQLLHRYAVWHLLRRLRQRNNNTHATHAQAVTVQRHVKAAIALLDGLATRGRALADARQADLDAWLTSDQATHRREAGHFARWAQARWLLHDHTVNPVDRVAGCSCSSTRRPPPRSAASPSSMCRPPNTQCASASATNP